MVALPHLERPSRASAVTSEILDRLPPQNLDAERGVLGSLLLDPEMCDEVALLLRPDDFYSDAHQKLYAHVLEMHSTGLRIDATLLVERLRKAGDLEAVGGMPYLAEIIEAVPIAAHAVYYAQIVQDKSTLRGLIHASTEILRNAYDESKEPAEQISHAEQRIFAVHDKRDVSEVASVNDVLLKVFAQIDARVHKQGAVGAVETGLAELDRLTGGLHDSELIVLAARPSVGKTALAANIAEHATVHRKLPTLFVSLEMSAIELSLRMLCTHARVSGHRVRDGFLNPQDRTRLVESSSCLSQAKLFVDDSPTRTLTEIAAAARRLKRKHGLGLIIVDYLQLIEPDNPRDPRQEQVAKIARRLKGLAREMKLPVLCLAQLNRLADNNEGPRLSHLRESGAIEQDADVVMLLHRKWDESSTDEEGRRRTAYTAELNVAKQRNGPTGELKLIWLPDYTRFENLDHRHGGATDEF